MRFRLAKCVWGEAYTETMLQVNLPSLLAPANLPTAASRHAIEHVIYTTPADAAVIRDHPAFRAVAAVAKTRIEAIGFDSAPGAEDYHEATIPRMNAVHNRILEECHAEGSVWLFDQPDHVWGDGSLSWLAETAATTRSCVVFPGIRTVKEHVVPELLRRARPDGTIVVANRDLARLAMEGMHIHDAGRLWGSGTATVWPHHVSWPAAPHAMLRRAFFTQPFAIAPPAGVGAERSVDMHYLARAFPDPDSLHFVRDSDDFFVLEVSARFHVDDSNPHPLTVPLIGSFAAAICDDYQLACFERTIRMHAGGIPETMWRRAERRSERVRRGVLAYRALHALRVHLERIGYPAARTLRRLLAGDMPSAWRGVPMPRTILLPSSPVLGAELDGSPAMLLGLVSAEPLPAEGPNAAGELPLLDGHRLSWRRVGGVLTLNDRIAATSAGEVAGMGLLRLSGDLGTALTGSALAPPTLSDH